MRRISDKNKKRFPPLYVGDEVVVDSPLVKTEGVIRGIGAERSPYKSVYEVEADGQKWYVFRHEIRKA